MMRSVLQKYFASEILRSVLFVLVAFLALFAFFDLINELPNVGRNGYRLEHAFLFVILGMPGYTYELMPIAALIGTIYALAQLAARSEFTIMRVSGMSTAVVVGLLARIGVLFVALTFVFGEFISPYTSGLAKRLKLQAQGAPMSQEFRSGLWAKDVIRAGGVAGEVIGSRFINAAEMRPDGKLVSVKLYEFDRNFRLSALINAARAEYRGHNQWDLIGVSETRFAATASGHDTTIQEFSQAISRVSHAHRDLVSEITPEILSVLFADPDRMSASDLRAYTRHLSENNQLTERYEIAFWKKLTYPLAVFVMMGLALPFAYLHTRSGGVSLKIFIGIMIGVSFQLLNSLFSHLGLLNTWPPFATAILPSACFVVLAVGALRWVERH
ncbi:MAG: LPS export ABC transporter permease LptG [Burkholderiaceae bacterium]